MRAYVQKVRRNPSLTRAKMAMPPLVWYENCSLNTATGKPEFTWFKAIQGNDSFYLIQVTLKVQAVRRAQQSVDGLP